jgi:amidase
MSTYIQWMEVCMMISSLENPSISMPCGFTAEGLPVGLQIVGRHRDEWSVLQMAYAFEQATPAARRRPAIA